MTFASMYNMYQSKNNNMTALSSSYSRYYLPITITIVPDTIIL